MRKKLSLLLLLLLIPTLCYAWGVMIVGGGVPAGASYPDITFWYSAENTNSPYWTTSDCSDGDTTPTLVSDAVINSDAGIIGTNGIDCPTVSDCVRFDSASIFDIGAFRIGFWLRNTTWANSASVFNFFEDANNYCRLRLDGTDELELRYKHDTTDDTFTTTTANIGQGTAYFIELAMVTNTASDDYCKIFVNGVEKYSETGLSLDPVEATDFEIGEDASTGADNHIDNFMISTDPTRDFCGLSGTCVGLADETTDPTGACDG